MDEQLQSLIDRAVALGPESLDRIATLFDAIAEVKPETTKETTSRALPRTWEHLGESAKCGIGETLNEYLEATPDGRKLRFWQARAEKELPRETYLRLESALNAYLNENLAVGLRVGLKLAQIDELFTGK